MKRLSQSITAVLLVCSCMLAKAQSEQTVNNGEQTQPLNFPAAGCSYNWTNNKPGIGLAVSGTGDIPAFTAINNGNTIITATIKATPVLPSYAYIANQGSNSITVIDGATHTVIGNIPIGATPVGVVASPDGMRVYTANNVTNSVSVINTTDNSKLTDIDVGGYPFAIAISPDSKWVYVSNENDGNISVINTQSNTIFAVINNLGSVTSICVSPDGKWVYAATEASPQQVFIIDTSSNLVVSSIPISTGQNIGMVISPNGEKLYFSNNQAGTVTVIDVVTKAISTIHVGFRPDLAFNSGPYGIAINSAGTRLYVSCSYQNEVDIINTATNAVIKTIPISGQTFSVSLSSDEKELYVTNRSANSVEVFSTSNYGKIATITDPGLNAPLSLGNFVSKGLGCGGAPGAYTIKILPSIPMLAAPPAAIGTITACAGSPSVSPNIQLFKLSGTNLNAGVAVQAPANFEVSLNPVSGYTSLLSLNPTAGRLNNTIIYVRSSQTASGTISDYVTITSAGATTQKVAVKGTVTALPSVNPLGPKTYNAGDITTPVSFTGPGNTYMWSNDNPAIGLATDGVGDIPSFTATNTIGGAIVGNVTVTPISAGYAYIANRGSGNVSVINTVTNKVIKTIGIGGNPYAVAVTPDGSKVYVTNLADKTVSIINTSDFSVNTTGLSKSPYGIIISPDGSKAYIANSNDNSISILNTATNAVSQISGVISPYGMALSADGNKLYVTSYSSDKLNVIDVVTQNITAITVGKYPWGISMSGDGGRIYVSNSGDGSVSVLDAASDIVIKTFYTGTAPTSLAVSPDGNELYVVSAAQNSVTAYSTSDYSITGTIGVGQAPVGISYSSDGLLYITNSGSNSNSVSVIDPAIHQVINTIDVGTAPNSLGNFISKSANCTGPSRTFPIKVNANRAKITAGPVIGNIIGCIGMPSVNPNIQRFTVNGSDLTGDIIVTAPPNFEVSLYAGSAYSNSVTLANSGGKVINVTVYVSSSAAATINTTDFIVLTSSGAADVKAAVSATITPIPVVDQVTPETYTAGDQASKIVITGTGQSYTWENSNPAIGLPAYGNGDIPPFTAINAGPGPVQADITVTPFTGSSCNGAAIHFIITVNAKPKITGGPVTGAITACAGSPSASPDLQQFTVTGSDLAGDIMATAPANFEVSLSAGGGFSNSAALVSFGGKVANVTVYVRSSASATVNTSDYIVLSSPGAADVKAAVSATITPIPSVDQIGDKTYATGDQASGITITGTGQSYFWANNNPAIGLPANGVGDIPPFTTINAGPGQVQAAITVTPFNGTCSGAPFAFTIRVNPVIPPAISTNQPLTGVNTVYGTPSSTTTFTISGDRMREGIKIIPQAGVEVSSDGINFGNTIIVGGAGTIPPVTIYVRLGKTTPAGQYGGTIDLSSAGAIMVSPQLPASAVTPAALTVTAKAKSKDYGTAITGATGSAEIIINGLQNNETAQTATIAYTAGSAAPDPAQIYTLSVKPTDLTGGTFDPKNYIITYFDADLTVVKVPLEITADNKTKVYKDPNPALTITYTGFVNGETAAQLTMPPVISTTANDTALPGMYPITIKGAMSPNYDIKYNNGVLTVRPLVLAVKIPNTFTPNGDGVNDTWNIPNIEAYPGCTVDIFNRWGQKVYASVGYAKSWDGLYKNAPLPVSTYYYIIDLKDGTKAYSGDVTIIR